jgi:hypothetical protein
MFTLFIIIFIGILYIPYAIKRIKAENRTYSNAVKNKSKNYYDNYGICRDTTTKQQLFHKIVNEDNCLVYNNGQIHTNLSELRRQKAEDLRLQLNKESYKKAKQLNKVAYRYIPRKGSIEDINNGNSYMIIFETGEIYKYDEYYWFYNKTNKKWTIKRIPVELTSKYV